MTNPFEKHGIDHISASSLRLFKENMAVWIGRYLLKVKDEAGPRAWRGLAVEAGLDAVLFSGADFDTALKITQLAWDNRAMGLADDAALKEYALLPDFLTQAMEAFKEFGTPVSRQTPIKIQIHGIEVPLTGFCDYLYPGVGYDLKTTHRIPSKADDEHIAQLSGYILANACPFKLVYVSSKRFSSFDITPLMAAQGLDQLTEAAHALRAFLSKVDNARDALTICAPDYDNFYFTPPMVEAVKAAKRPNGSTPSNGE